MEKEQQKKNLLISKMLEAKRIELGIIENQLLYKLKILFKKPEKTKSQKINELKKSLEKKETDELELMLVEKEHALIKLETTVKEKKDKEKLKEVIKLVEKIKNSEGERGKIGMEIGLKRKEIKELKKEVEQKLKDITREKTILTPKKKKIKKTEIKKGKKTKKKKEKNSSTLLKKRKKEKVSGSSRKLKKKTKIEMKKPKISFSSPEEELKAKREQEVKEKRKKAMAAFHQNFTSGNETLINIKGNAQIVSGTRGTGTTGINNKETAKQTEYAESRKNEELEFDIQKTKEKIKNLKSAFFHRQINEETYKKKQFEYQEELSSLEMEKKRPKKRSFAPVQKTESVSAYAGLKTVQDESVQFATKHTQKSRAKVKNALKRFKKEFNAGSKTKANLDSEEKTRVKTEPEEIKPTGIIKRLAPGTSQEKEMEMEKKLYRVMQKNQIDQSRIRREFEFVSAKDLMKRFDKILDVIDNKYSQTEKPAEKEEKPFEEGLYVTNKQTSQKTGEIRDIKEKIIVTDFDRLLELVNKKGKVNEKEAEKTLKLSPERIKECYTVLEKNDLIRIEYPMFGGTQIFSKNFVEPKKIKKKKK